ncbi:hypothetical protein [Ruminococcus sp.]|uniref:hypothetical protein n=1 Tax=Ruminococcus sp. TaxID=41978 RepID=UPI0025802239|nr:hypothetical protein [Ruminococcus sp.]
MSHKVFHCVQNFGDRHSGRGQAGRTAQLYAPCTPTFNASDIKKHPTHFVRGLGVVEVACSNQVTPTNI